MSSYRHIICVLLIIPYLFASCSKGTGLAENSIPEDDPVVEVTDNDFKPITLDLRTRGFVDEGNRFAYKLLKGISNRETGSFMISPLGVTMVFGMVIESAKDGEALDEVCQVLGFEDGTKEEIRNYCTMMLSRLPEMDKLSKVSFANMVLLNSAFGPIRQDFNKAVSGYHNALVKDMPFSEPGAVVQFVNDWAKEHTNGMIENAISKDDIDAFTTAILSDALYFDGKWKSRFKKSDTEKEKFTMADGSTRDVDMMKQETVFSFREFYDQRSLGWGCLRIPYGNGAFAMDVYLPFNGEKGIDGILDILVDESSSVRSEWDTPKTDLWLPKFELKERRINLEGVLTDLGMNKAFTDDWLSFFEDSKIDSTIGRAFQTTAMKVEESGTEASAVTVVVAKLSSPGPGYEYDRESNKLTFHADQPFIFTIIETSTDAILFSGVYRGE